MIDRALIPLESEITKKIQRYLRTVPGWWGFKVLGGAQQKRGVPDIIGCFNGIFVAFEVKRPGVGVVSDLQAHIIEQIKSANGHSFVVYSVDDVKAALAGLAARSFVGGGDDYG